MNDQEFLLNIDKEILIAILNHSIDFLVASQDDQQTMRMSNKYGFINTDDFLLTRRNIAKFYRNFCYADGTNVQSFKFSKSEFSNLTPEFQNIVTSALQCRRNEVLSYLIKEQNAVEWPLIESFDWDTRLIVGDSCFAKNNKLLTTLTLSMLCNHEQSDKQQLHIEMNCKELSEFIKTIEDVVDNLK